MKNKIGTVFINTSGNSEEKISYRNAILLMKIKAIELGLSGEFHYIQLNKQESHEMMVKFLQKEVEDGYHQHISPITSSVALNWYSGAGDCNFNV